MNISEDTDIGETKPTRVGVGGQADEESFVVMVSDDRAFKLSPGAFYVWALCDGEHTVSQIIDDICSETGLARSDVEEPVITIIKTLAENGLVNIEKPSVG